MRVAVVLLLLAVSIGCASGSDSPASDSVPASSAKSAIEAPSAPGSDTTAAGACILAELWSPCLLRKALENAGLAPIEEDSVRHSFLVVGGRRWRLGRAELQTFIYPDPAALRADLTAFDTSSAQPRSGSRVDWSGRPETIVSRNLMAVLAGGTDRQRERVRNALEAGVLGVRAR